MSIVSHLSVGSTKTKFKEMIEFYDRIMPILGAKRQMVVANNGPKLDTNASVDATVVAVAYGKYYPEFWVQLPENEKRATVGNGTHIAFTCSSQEQVKQVYEAAMETGGTDNGAPGVREEYSEKYEYYGAFFLDPVGNKLEATFVNLGIWNYCVVM